MPLTLDGTGSISGLTTNAYGVVCGSTTGSGALQNIAAGSSGQALLSNGTSALPSFQTIKGPAFHAYMGTNQTLSSAWSTIAFATEEYDVGGCYNNLSTSATLNGLSVPAYSFMPNVAGYYQINACVRIITTSATFVIGIYKTGTNIFEGSLNVTASAITAQASVASSIVYLNGTSDYVTIQAYNAAVPQTADGTKRYAWFTGCMLRAA